VARAISPHDGGPGTFGTSSAWFSVEQLQRVLHRSLGVFLNLSAHHFAAPKKSFGEFILQPEISPKDEQK